MSGAICICGKVNKSDKGLKALWEVHKRFNKELSETVQILFALHKGKIEFCREDPTLAKNLIEAAGKIKNKAAILNAFTLPKWKSAAIEKRYPKLHERYLKQRNAGNLRHIPTWGAPWPVYRDLVKQVAVEELATWFGLRKERQKNLKFQYAKIADFKAKNPEFMEVLPIIDEWHQKHGQSGKTDRWQKHQEFLVTDNRLVKWNNPNAEIDISGLTIDGKKATATAIYNKNPSLAELMEKNSKWREISKIPKPPTYTLPHAEKHPSHVRYTYSTPKTIFGFDIVENGHGTLVLRTLDGPITIDFKADKRIGALNDKNVIINGVKHTFLSLTVMMRDDKNAELRFALKYDAPKVNEFEKAQNRIVVAVDMGVIHETHVVVYDYDNKEVIDTKKANTSNKLTKIEEIAFRIKNKSSQTWRMANRIHGKHKNKSRICANLYQLKNNLMDEYASQLANEIITYLLPYHESNVYILLENLKTFLPNDINNSYFNKKIAKMARLRLKKYLASISQRHGIIVEEVPSFGTSQLCNKCLTFGIRLSDSNGKYSRATCGKWFYCPKCETIEDSDHNGAMNLIHAKEKKLTLPGTSKDRKKEQAKIFAEFKKSHVCD